MTGFYPIRGNLITAQQRQAALLTLAFILVLTSHLCLTSHRCHADNYYTDEQKRQISDVENYIRKQGLHGLSLLPGSVKSAVGWFSGSWHAMPMVTDESGEDLAPGAQGLAQPQIPANPNAALTSSDEGVPVNLASNFHHKGFLPTRDAMVMGVGIGRSMFDKKIQLTARPFYGQSWRSLQGYWGMETTMDIAQREDGMPWGKITLGYIGGNESLTDHGRGMDMHGDVDLTHGWRFTSGLRQNSVDGDSNYVMLRWKMDFN